jgi:hypothetical protein
MDKQCETLINVDFDSFDVDDQVDTKISSVDPNNEWADDNLYEYEFPKQIKLKFEATVFVSQGSAAPAMFGTPRPTANLSFGIEVPDQEISVDYVRINVITDERETLTAKHMLKNLKVSTNEHSAHDTKYGGKFWGGLVPDRIELYDKTVWFEYE